MFMVELDGGAVVFRLDVDPTAGEAIVASWPVDRPPGDYEYFDVGTGGFQLRPPAEVETILLAHVDIERERLYEAMFEETDVRRIEYLNKTIEAYSDIGPWPYLQRLAEQKGTTVEDERLAVMAARDAAEAERSTVAALAVAGKAAIREALTVEAKLEAFHAIQWPPEGE